VFAYDAFVKNNEWVKMQCAFRIHFKIGCRDSVPNWKTIMRWVNAFQTGIITKKSPDLKYTATTPENMKRVSAVGYHIQSLRRLM